MCNNEKIDILNKAILDLEQKNIMIAIDEALKHSSFNAEYIKSNKQKKERLKAYLKMLSNVDCKCEYCIECQAKHQAEEVFKNKTRELENANERLKESHKELVARHNEMSKNIVRLTDTVKELLKQVSLIEDNYNIIETINKEEIK